MKTEIYTRRPFTVEAVQVTDTNMDEIAKWCDGKVEDEAVPTKRFFIRVKVRHPLNSRQTKAYVGDWVLMAGQGFKVYNEQAFEKSFIRPSLRGPIETMRANLLQAIDKQNADKALVEQVNATQRRTIELGEPEVTLVHPDQGRFETIDFDSTNLAVHEIKITEAHVVENKI